MNQKIILIGMLFASSLSVQIHGQTQTEKFTHPFVEGTYGKNEFSFNLSPFIAVLTGEPNLPSSFIASVGYNINFRKQNFFRAGVKVMALSLPGSGRDYSTNTFYNTSDFRILSQSQLPSFNDMAIIANTTYYKLKTSFYLGFEHLFGRSRTRFLLGLDTYAGFSYINATDNIESYSVTYNRDSVSGNYNATVNSYAESRQEISATCFHWGISPRIGVRFEASKRIALTAVACPMFYMEFNSYNYNAQTYQFAPTNMNSLLDVQPIVAEVGLHVKL